MRLNELKPAEGSKKAPRRVGRGVGSGLGKTCGRGHKGQHSRTGHFKTGFEGGQMPLQRRLPKVGFISRKARYEVELPLSALNKLPGNEVSLQSLKEAGLVRHFVREVKIILSGEIGKPVTLRDIKATQGAVQAILAAGGSVE